MGILNLTTDSFSDGGRWLDPADARSHGLELAQQGAAVIDLGGESTRPGAEPVPPELELARVVPLVEALAGAGLAVSVDTTRAVVAAAAIAAGALIVNDVSGGLADPDLLPLVADSPAGYVVMHWRGRLDADDSLAVYDDAPVEVVAELMERVEAALAAGLDRQRLVIDPGLGFSKRPEHNWALLREVDRWQSFGWPVLWGASRKRFLVQAYPDPTAPDRREAASQAVTAWLAQRRVWAVRCHTVPGHRAAVAVAERLRSSRPSGLGHPVSRSHRPVVPAPWPLGPLAPVEPILQAEPEPKPMAVPIDPKAVEPIPAAELEPTGDRIDLTGLTVAGRHGVYDWEKTTDQPFRVDLRAWLAPLLSRADRLDQTVDYGRLAQAVTELVAGPSCDLIETLADRIAQAALALGSLSAVEVTVHKPEAPLAAVFADVSVTVRRTVPVGSAASPVVDASAGSLAGAAAGSVIAASRVRAVFSLGSNLGDRLGWLQFGLAGLAATDGLDLVAVSSLYQTAAVGPVDQPDFLNLVLVVETDRSAEELLRRGLEVEAAAGRRRDVAHGPRNLDIDLIAVGQQTRATVELALPHPRAQERAFVLIPWLEVDPTARLRDRPLTEWLSRLDGQSVQRRDDLRLAIPTLQPGPTAPSGQAAQTGPAAQADRPEGSTVGGPR
jgi:dihydropteroate synthase/2-amino-4-hydroxy-6-hydroxymethyldihydropteridine diphosphokinase/dihydroneopterin aldolase